MLDMREVVRLSFEKEEFMTKMLPQNAETYSKFLRALVKRIEGMIARNNGQINEEIASEIVIASMTYIGLEVGLEDDASYENIATIVNNFMASAMLDLNLSKEDLQ